MNNLYQNGLVWVKCVVGKQGPTGEPDTKNITVKDLRGDYVLNVDSSSLTRANVGPLDNSKVVWYVSGQKLPYSGTDCVAAKVPSSNGDITLMVPYSEVIFNV